MSPVFGLGRLTSLLVACLFFGAGYASAATTITGNVLPADPANWNTSTSLNVGYNGTGVLQIDGGTAVSVDKVNVGYATSGDGQLIVDGVGTSLFLMHAMTVGRQGGGDTAITGGAMVQSEFGYLGEQAGASGIVTVSGSGSVWQNTADLIVGNGGEGTLNITQGGSVSDVNALVAGSAGSTGTVLVTGLGSTWTNAGDLQIGGASAPGLLTIRDDGSVSVTGRTTLSTVNDLSVIDFDGGTLTTTEFWGASKHLHGQGAMYVNSLVADIDLVFDAAHGVQQQFMLAGEPGQNIEVNLNLRSQDTLGIGYKESGTLLITQGREIENQLGLIGSVSTSDADAFVEGAGSSWNVTDTLTLDGYGSRLRIANGAQVTAENLVLTGRNRSGDDPATILITSGGSLVSGETEIAYSLSRNGAIVVDGIGSSWISDDTDLRIGHSGQADLSILNGATVSHSGVSRLGYDGGSTATAVVDGLGSRWDVDKLLVVGDKGIGVLTITDGAEVYSRGGTIGADYHPGYVAHGHVTIDGPGSLWAIEGYLSMGLNGNSMLTLTDSGRMTVSGDATLAGHYLGDATVTVDGPGSVLGVGGRLKVGEDGDADLSVLNGGVVTANSVSVSSKPQANGESSIAVNGIGSRMEVGGSIVMSGFRNSFAITDAGAVTAESLLVIGTETVFLIDGPGSSLDLTGGLAVDSDMQVTGGARVTSTTGELYPFEFDHFPVTGTTLVRVSGAGSNWEIADSLDLGTTGPSNYHGNDVRLEVLDGAVIHTNTLAMGNQAYRSELLVEGGGSQFIIDGGVDLTNLTGSITVRDGGLMSINGGILYHLVSTDNTVLQLADGGTLDMNGFSIGPGNASSSPMTFEFTGGDLFGLAGYTGEFNQQGGTFHLGGDAAVATIDGTIAIQGGVIEAALVGGGGTLGVLSTTGDIDIALLGTTLDLPGIGPIDAGTYTIIESTGGNLTGMFEHVTGIGMYAGLVDVSYTANAVLVTLNWDFVPGDLDGDGFVGIADLNLILGNWNQNVVPYDLLSADVTGDGFVGIADLNAVLGNWNTGTPPPAEALALVPEPGAVCMLIVGVGRLVNRRGRRVMY